MRPAYAHANQRSFYSLDSALSEQVERITDRCGLCRVMAADASRACFMGKRDSCWLNVPEPIPVGEASESEWGEFVDAMWGDL